MFESLYSFLTDTIDEARLRSCKTILEFGSGKTGFVDRYRSDEQIAYALDLHETFRSHWEERGVKYLLSDGKTIPLPDKSVDLVVSHSVVEHVENLPNSLAEIDRVLKVHGYAYITVSPLYFSPQGSHIRTLPDWEHLRPGSKYYMMHQPIEREGAYLNKLTMKELLGMVGDLPWNIVRMDRKILNKEVPEWLLGHNRLDLLTREFRLIVKKLPT